MGSTNDSNVLIKYLEYILQFLYDSYYDISDFIKEYKLYALIFVPIIVLSGLIYYLSFKNPYDIMNYIQTPSTIIYVALTTFLLTLYFYLDYNKEQTNILNPIKKYLTLFGTIFMVYLLISLFYYISKNVMYYGTKESLFGSVIIIICLMGIFYKLFIVQRNRFGSDVKKIYSTYDLFIDIVFYIPCLLIDGLEYIKEEYKNTHSTVFILSGIVTSILLFFYILPYFINFLKKDKGIKLLKQPNELDKNVVFISQKELREKIIKNRPLLQRQLLNFTNKIENQINLHGKYFESRGDLFDLSKIHDNRKYLDTKNSFKPLIEHPSCIGKKITCDSSDNLLKCDGQRLDDFYDIYQRCGKNDDSLWSSLFSNPKDSVRIYPNSSKDKLLSLQEMCNIDVDLSDENTSVNCISYNDISNQVINSNPVLADQSFYFCNDISVNVDNTAGVGTSDKYKVIYGYNDISDISGPISCVPPRIYEGFEGNLHNLDNLIENKNLLKEFSESERAILQRAINSEETNLKYVIEQLKDDPEKAKEYIISFFASNDNFMTLMDYVNKYNNESNIFLNQELSNLIKQINLRSNLHEYNYHYGLSFWVYFDSSILNANDSNENNQGLIMNYANQPYIYYDYNTQELIIKVSRHSSNNNEQNYKTKDILYQNWNHFVINYNYGTLDIFINNNLVGTINKLNPYVEKNNNIVFGSSSKKLEHCGICNIVYYEIPLKLNKIKEIYKKHENPCF